MNNQVSVTGMKVHTQVSNNLLIALAEGHGTNAMPLANAYKTQYVASISALLEPVSSTTGQDGSFWYTSITNVASNGNATTDVYEQYDNSDTSDFDANYGTTGAVGYIDYIFALQATNTDSVKNLLINMTKCDLTYDGTDTTEKAFRVALLVQECVNNDGTATDASTTVNTITILSPLTSAYFDQNGSSEYVAISANAAPTVAVVNLDEKAIVATVEHGQTKYYKVTVRLWLEGEDTTCTSATFADLTKEWTLDLNFVLEENDTNAKNKINQANAPEYEILSTADRLTAFDKTFAGTTYYAYQAEDSKTVWGDNATLGSVSRWFNITNDNEVYEVTVFVLCTVTFDSQGGSAVASLTNVRSGSGIIAPTAPTLDGKTFNGWYKEAACTNAWDFSTDTVTADTTLYAKWVD